MKKYLLYFWFVMFFLSCKKNDSLSIYTISGRILKSSSNPILVKNYRIELYQKQATGFLGSSGSVFAESNTDNNGTFSLVYQSSKGFGFAGNGTNPNYISIMGDLDTSQGVTIYPYWFNIEPNKNFDIGDIYLTKKVNMLERSISFNRLLLAGDTLFFSTPTKQGKNSSFLIGPIGMSSNIIADTLYDITFNNFDITKKSFIGTGNIGYGSGIEFYMDNKDENFVKQHFNYP